MREAIRPHRYIAVLSLILFGAFALRLWNLGAQSLWHDEAWSVFSAYHPLAWGAPDTDPNSPPLFYLSLGAWLQGAGDGVWALRYWSLMIGVSTVAVTAYVTRRWFGDRSAIGAAFLVALSPILWVFSQEIRAYVMLPVYALILLVLLDRVWRSPTRRVWLSILLIELLALYTHNLAVPLVAWLNVAALAAWFLKRDWRHMAIWLATQLALVIAYLPWLLTQRPTGTALNTPPALTPAILLDIWQSYFTGIKALINADPLLLTLVTIFGVLGLIATASALGGRRSTRLYLLGSQALLVPVFELGLIWTAHIDFHPRYFIAGVPATLALIAVGMDAIGSRWTSQRNLPSHDTLPKNLHSRLQLQAKWIAIGSATVMLTTWLIAATITLIVLRLVALDPAYQHDDFRAIAAHYTALTPNDAIVVPYGWEPALAYYASKLSIRAPIVGVSLGSPWQSIADQLNALHAQRVEVLTWYQAPADLRGAYPCLLGAVTQVPPSLFTVYGLTSAGYDHPAQIEPRTLSTQPISFGLFETSATQVVAGDRRTCVIGDWTLAHKTDTATHASFRVTTGLLNPPGWVFTHADADLRDDHQVPTQFWVEGQHGSSFTLLDYPVGTPPGNYPLVTGLYAADSLRGLDVIRDGAPVGQSATVGALAIPMATLAESELARYTFAPVAERLSVALPEEPAVSSCSLQPGQQFRLTALWRNDGGPAQTILLRLRGPGWNLENQTPIPAGVRAHLAWYTFTVPAQSNGQAILAAVAPDGGIHTLLTCTLTPAKHLLNPPAMQQPLGVTLAGVGTLAGFDAPRASLSRTGTVTLTLYWRADETPATAYTVFTHLLDSAGQVIAQDDSPPANGQRPTTGWLRGEYVTDPHTLVFNARGQGYTGSATLEVGLYDPVSGARVLASNGADHVLLPISVSVR